MGNPQQLANYVQTTLASGCTSAATTLTLTSVSGLPTTGNFMLRIDDPAPATTFEYVEVSSVNVGASQVTCTRGQEGTTGIAHSAGAFVGNELTAAMLQRSMAQGTLGYAQITANSAASGGATDVVGLSITVTVPAGRRLLITAFMYSCAQVGAGGTDIQVREATTTLATGAGMFAAGNSPAIIVHAVVTPTAGAHTYKVTTSTSATSAAVTAGVPDPAFILVEDIGQA